MTPPKYISKLGSGLFLHRTSNEYAHMEKPQTAARVLSK